MEDETKHKERQKTFSCYIEGNKNVILEYPGFLFSFWFLGTFHYSKSLYLLPHMVLPALILYLSHCYHSTL